MRLMRGFDIAGVLRIRERARYYERTRVGGWITFHCLQPDSRLTATS
jgi:hypothetical protein